MLRKDRILVYVLVFYMLYSICYAYETGGGFRIEDGKVYGGPSPVVFSSPLASPIPWSKPSWASIIWFWCVGGGAAGGLGGKGSGLLAGGTAGASSPPSEGWFLASEVPNTLYVTVGAGAQPIATPSVIQADNTAPTGAVGSGGASGICSSSTQTVNSDLCFVASSAGNGSSQAQSYSWASRTVNLTQCKFLMSYAPGYGGTGGGIGGSSPAAGSAGGDGCISPSSGGVGGSVGGGAGGDGGSYLTGRRVGGGGGGGGASSTSNGGAGGAGGRPGGGGGGGGSVLNGTNYSGGRGGKGGDGLCLIVSF